MLFYSIHQFRGSLICSRFGVSKSRLGIYLSVAQTISFVFGLKAAAYNDQSGRQKLLIGSSILLSVVVFQLFFLSKFHSHFLATVHSLFFSFIYYNAFAGQGCN